MTTTDGRQYLLNIFCMSTETDRLSTGMVDPQRAAFQESERIVRIHTILASNIIRLSSAIKVVMQRIA